MKGLNPNKIYDIYLRTLNKVHVTTSNKTFFFTYRMACSHIQLLMSGVEKKIDLGDMNENGSSSNLFR